MITEDQIRDIMTDAAKAKLLLQEHETIRKEAWAQIKELARELRIMKDAMCSQQIRINELESQLYNQYYPA